MIDHGKMQVWLRRELFSDHRDGSVTHFIVRHIANGKYGADLLTLTPPSPLDESWLVSAISAIEAQTEMDASGIGGTQGYCVQSYRVEASERASSRYTFRVSGDATDEEELSSEPSNGKGLIAQAMRHTEVMMRSTTVAIGQVIATQGRTIDRLASENESMHKQQARFYEVLEELSSRKHERELELKKEERKELITQQVVDKAMLLAPSIVNRISGKKLLQEKTTPLVDSIKEFMCSLNDQQMNSLMGMLSMEQKIVVGNIISGFAQDGTDPDAEGNKSVQ